MRPRLILREYPLELKEVPIGSFVVDLAYPHQDAMKGDKEEIDLNKDCTKSVSEGPAHQLEASATTTVWASFQKILGLSVSAASSSSSRIVADQTVLYELRNPKARLTDLVDDEKVRQWIQSEIEGGEDIYLITGFQTATNQRVQHSDNQKLSGSQSTNIPIGNNALQAGQGVSYEQLASKQDSYKAPEERVFAIRARRVIVREIKAIEVDQSTGYDYKLERNVRFRMLSDNRTSGDDGVSEQIVEVVLEDEDTDFGASLSEVICVGPNEFVYCVPE
ncbi:hypothetical protein BU16DRAFT_339911 [Lophium mytilinum]|uniref:Uncharacterized protein n=1 Tax=Lophium mytilinum TaxID=390894 RepID=A0A6A6QWX4_9PEZI|nr:hypothetical protein BU16DRAFT_339911 [Lophium mytilinum]